MHGPAQHFLLLRTSLAVGLSVGFCVGFLYLYLSANVILFILG